MNDFKDFTFMGSFRQCIDNLPGQRLIDELLRSIMEYGTEGSYNSKNPYIISIMSNISQTIDDFNKQREIYVNNGSKGGRPHKTDYNLIAKNFLSGISKDTIAKELNISIKTINRALHSIDLKAVKIELEKGKKSDMNLNNIFNDENKSEVEITNSPTSNFFDDKEKNSDVNLNNIFND